MKGEPLPLGRAEIAPFGLPQEPVGHGEIAVLEQTEERVLLPLGSVEAPVRPAA